MHIIMYKYREICIDIHIYSVYTYTYIFIYTRNKNAFLSQCIFTTEQCDFCLLAINVFTQITYSNNLLIYSHPKEALLTTWEDAVYWEARTVSSLYYFWWDCQFSKQQYFIFNADLLEDI